MDMASGSRPSTSKKWVEGDKLNLKYRIRAKTLKFFQLYWLHTALT
jgi:hypothetical protein